MADYKIRAVWDVGNAAQFEQQIKQTVSSSRSAIQSAAGAAASPATEVQNILTQSEGAIRRFTNNVKPAFEGLRGAFTDPAIKASLGNTISLLDQQVAKVRLLREEYVRAKAAAAFPEKLPPTSGYGSITAQIEQAKIRLQSLPVTHQIEANVASTVLAQREAELQAASKFYKGGARNPLTAGLSPLGGGYYAPEEAIRLRNLARQNVDELAGIQATEVKNTEANIVRLTELREAERIKLGTIAAGKNADLRAANAQYVASQQAANAELGAILAKSTTVVNPELTALLNTSPAALSQLRGRGFGVSGTGNAPPVGTNAFAQTLQQQEASITTLTKNADQGLTTLGVRFKNLNENARLSASGVQSATVTIRDNGEIVGATAPKVGKLADNYTGLARVIQRTIEYAVVAGVAYAAFGTTLGQIQSINEINTQLNRLSVTANLSGIEINDLFGSLAQVAYQTATPLTELLKSADDIALAVRRAGQSTQEYRDDIISLTQAVGILTNLSGINTVAATDQLSSAFKQLAIAPSELIGILNKVTAVAGGQSSAIADIVQGLGSVASAAKTAGLSTDQMIASLQVLGQVTSKTPDELAFAFKALFGALNSPGSIKTLKEFGIAVRDTENNVRPFLQVYQEISEAIAKGIIPEGQIETVVRAIAGGPRRAPDAAALLENIGRVSAVTALALGSTNEALLANAKVLDTNTAKATQLKVAFDAAAYKSFASVVNDVVAGLLNLGLSLTQIIKVLPGPQIISLLVSMGSLLLATKLLSGAGSLLANNFGLVTKEATAATTAIEGQTAAATAAAKTGLFGGRGGRAAGAAVIGGAVSAASGGGIGDIAGAALTTAGFALFAANPIIGGLAILGGQILPNLTKSQRESSAALAANSQEVIGNISAYKTASAALEGATDARTRSLATIERLQGIENKTAQQTNDLNSAYHSYATASIDVINANTAMSESFNKLIEEIPSVAAALSTALIAQGGVFDPEALRKAQIDLSRVILSQTSGYVAPEDYLAGLANIPTNRAVAATGSQAVYSPRGKGIDFQAPYGINDLTGSTADEIKKRLTDLFEGGFTFTPTVQNLQIIDAALNRIKGDIPDDQMIRWRLRFQEIESGASSVLAIQQQINTEVAYFKSGSALGQYTTAQQSFIQNRIDLQKAIASGIGRLPVTPEEQAYNVFQSNLPERLQAPRVPAAQQRALALIEQLRPFDEKGQLVGGGAGDALKITRDVADEAYRSILLANGGIEDFNKLNQQGKDINEALYYRDLGISVDGLSEKYKNLLGPTEDEISAQEKLAAAFQSVLTGIDQNTLQAYAQFLATSATNPAGAGAARENYDRIKARNDALKQTGQVLLDTFKNGGIDDGSDALGTFEEKLVGLIGFENAAGLKAEEFAALYINVAQTLGLSAVATDKFTAKLRELYNLQVKQVALQSLLAHVDPVENPEAYANLINQQSVLTDGEEKLLADLKNIESSGAGSAFDSLTSSIEKNTISLTRNREAWEKLFAAQIQGILNQAASAKAQREASLAVQISQGDYSGKGGAARLAAIRAEYDAAYEGQVKVTKAIADFEQKGYKEGGSKQSAANLRLIENGFKNIPGFADAATLSTGEFIERIISQGIALGLTSKQIDILIGKILAMIATIAAIPSQKTINIEIVTDFLQGQGIKTRGQAIGQGGLAGDVASALAQNPNIDLGPSAAHPSAADQAKADWKKLMNDPDFKAFFGGGAGGSLNAKGAGGGSKGQGPAPGLLDLAPEILKSEQLGITQQPADIATIIANAKKLQGQIPGQTKRDKDAVVEILDGTNRVAEVRGISEELLRKSMDELNATEKKRLEFDTKADQIRRIRVGSGDFAALANVPFNSTSGVSVGGTNNITININGAGLTPAQYAAFADKIASEIKRSIASG